MCDCLLHRDHFWESEAGGGVGVGGGGAETFRLSKAVISLPLDLTGCYLEDQTPPTLRRATKPKCCLLKPSGQAEEYRNLHIFFVRVWRWQLSDAK